MKKGLLFLTSLMLCLLVVSTSCSGNMDDKVDVTPPVNIKKVPVNLTYYNWPFGSVTFALESSDLSVSQYLPKSPSPIPDINAMVPVDSVITVVLDYTAARDVEIPDNIYYSLGNESRIYKAVLKDKGSSKLFAFDYKVRDGENIINLMPARTFSMEAAGPSFEITSDVGDALENGYIDICQYIDVELKTLPLNVGTDPNDQEILISVNGDTHGYYEKSNRFYLNVLELGKTPLNLDISIEPIKTIQVHPAKQFPVNIITSSGKTMLTPGGEPAAVALPYGSSLTLNVVDKYNQISSILWKANDVPLEGYEFEYKDIKMAQELKPVADCSDSVLVVFEPSIGYYASVEYGGNVLKGSFESGSTIYKIPFGETVILKSQKHDEVKFSGWGNRIGDRDPLPLELNNAITRVEPVYTSNVTEGNIFYVAPSDPVFRGLRGDAASDNLGSESLPFKSLESALDAAKNGQEIRLFEGEHFIDRGTLTIDKSVTISGGWRPGMGRVNFDDVKGAPSNIATHIRFRGPVSGSFINITAEEKAEIVLDGISIRECSPVIVHDEETNEDLSYNVREGIVSDRANLTVKNTYIELMLTPPRFGGNMGIRTNGDLDILNSTIDLSRSVMNFPTAVKVEGNTKHASIESSILIAGNKDTDAAAGFISQTNSLDVRINDSEILTEGKMAVVGAKVNSGSVTKSTIKARASSVEVYGYCIEHTGFGNAVIADNLLCLDVKDAGAEGVSAAVYQTRDNLFISNNSIIVETNAADVNGIYCGPNAEASILGNYISLSFDYTGEATEDPHQACGILSNEGHLSLMHNTVRVQAKNPNSEAACLKSVHLDNHSSATVSLNNIYNGIMGANQGKTRAYDFEGDHIVYVSHDAVYDFSDSILKLDGERQASLEATKNALENASQTESSVVLFGEGVGEDKPGWNSNCYNEDMRFFVHLSGLAPAAIRDGGLYVSRSQIYNLFLNCNFHLPEIQFNYVNALDYDMNGSLRIRSNNLLSIGAARY